MGESREDNDPILQECLEIFPASEAYEIAGMANQTYVPAIPPAVKKLQTYAEKYKVTVIRHEVPRHVQLTKVAGIALIGYGLAVKDLFVMGGGLGILPFGVVKGEKARQQDLATQRTAANRRTAFLGSAIAKLKGRVGEEGMLQDSPTDQDFEA